MTALRVLRAAIVAASVLLTAACAAPASAPAGPGDGVSASAPGGGATSADGAASEPGGGAGGSACPAAAQGGFDLFSSEAILKGPDEGQVFGGADHPISFTFAEPPGATPDIELSYVDASGAVIPAGGSFLEDLGGNVWGSSNDIFWSAAADRPGFVVLGLTTNASVKDGEATGDHKVLGVYCLTLNVTE